MPDHWFQSKNRVFAVFFTIVVFLLCFSHILLCLCCVLCADLLEEAETRGVSAVATEDAKVCVLSVSVSLSVCV